MQAKIYRRRVARGAINRCRSLPAGDPHRARPQTERLRENLPHSVYVGACLQAKNVMSERSFDREMTVSQWEIAVEPPLLQKPARKPGKEIL